MVRLRWPSTAPALGPPRPPPPPPPAGRRPTTRGCFGSRVVGSICGRFQAASCARLCSRYGGGGKGSLDPASGNRRAAGAPCELCSLLELSSLDPGLGARAQGEWRAASIARGSRRTCAKKRSGWDYASVGHLACLVQACVKGPYLYLYLYLAYAARVHNKSSQVDPKRRSSSARRHTLSACIVPRPRHREITRQLKSSQVRHACARGGSRAPAAAATEPAQARGRAAGCWG